VIDDRWIENSEEAGRPGGVTRNHWRRHHGGGVVRQILYAS
jgi:hypothetical protein